MRDVDIVISCVGWPALYQQTVLVDAAKEANIKRFIPCDFGIPYGKDELGWEMSKAVGLSSSVRSRNTNLKNTTSTT